MTRFLFNKIFHVFSVPLIAGWEELGINYFFGGRDTEKLLAYPSVVNTGQIFYVESGINTDLLKDSTIEIHTLLGDFVEQTKVRSAVTLMEARYPAGNYMVTLKTKYGTKGSAKIEVR